MRSFERFGIRRWLVGGLILGLAAPALAQDGDAIAIVNGRPISKRKMVDLLLEAHGLNLMQQLIVLELSKGEAQRRKLKVTAEDVARESADAASKIAPHTGATGQALTEEEKTQALEYLLREKGLSLTEFRLAMERNAHLRKCVEADLKVDDATLREEFARLYGEKVQVRGIQIGDVNGLHEALNLLDRGTPFGDVARKVSQDPATAQDNGLFEPFAFNDDTYAPVLREAAFALQPGERTKPIRVGRWWFILQLEKRIPPENVEFESVREEVLVRLKERVVPAEMNRLVTELFAKAEVKVLDRKLKPQFEEFVKKNQLLDPNGP